MEVISANLGVSLPFGKEGGKTDALLFAESPLSKTARLVLL
jgi:hypothetical protein